MVTLIAFFCCPSIWVLRWWLSFARCSPLPHTKHALLSFPVFFFLELVVFLGYHRPTSFPHSYCCDYFSNNNIHTSTILCSGRCACNIFCPSFSPTSRAMIRLSVEISSLLCFRVVAKSLYEVGSLAIMPAATTLLGIGHPRLTIIQDRSSNLWACLTIDFAASMRKSNSCSQIYSKRSFSEIVSLCSSASHNSVGSLSSI
jgi:hypothetical protein